MEFATPTVRSELGRHLYVIARSSIQEESPLQDEEDIEIGQKHERPSTITIHQQSITYYLFWIATSCYWETISVDHGTDSISNDQQNKIFESLFFTKKGKEKNKELKNSTRDYKNLVEYLESLSSLYSNL